MADFLNSGNDEAHATNVIGHLMAALGRAKDPNLRESLSNALAALHKHVANFQKEHQQALAGKLSPRLLEQAHGGRMVSGSVVPPSGHVDTGYNPAQYQLAIGNTQQAVADWEAHHPYAMSHGHIPGWVQNYLLSQFAHVPVGPAPGQMLQAYTNAPANTFTAQ